MTLSPLGYSGKSVPDKLGYKSGTVAAFLALPESLAELAKSTAFARMVRGTNWTTALPARTFDLIHAFTTSQAEVTDRLVALQAALKPEGMIWVSWPKKAAKVVTD